MGKQKRRKEKPHKKSPTCLPSVKDFEESENCSEDDRTTALDRVLEEVQSANVEEKLSGLQTLESMCCDSALAVRVAKSGAARIIGPLLVDPSVPVRAAAASALRHAASHGGEESYTAMLNDDIMTPLCALFNKYYLDWRPRSATKSRKGVDDDEETFVEATTLLWTLCERSELATKRSSRENLVSCLARCFDARVYGPRACAVASQCALTLSEDNPVAVETLREHRNTLESLLQLEALDSCSEHDLNALKTPVAGLLLNLSEDGVEHNLTCVSKALRVFSETLSVNHVSLLRDVVALQRDAKDSPSAAKKKIQETARILGAQQQALEMLANLCAEDCESETGSDLDSSEAECETECVHDDPMNDGSLKMVSTLPVEAAEIIGACELIRKVYDKTKPVEKEVREVLGKNVQCEALLRQAHVLRCRAYSCLGNLLSGLEIEAFGGAENLYRSWIETGTVVFTEADSKDIELLESATTAMRAILDKLAEARANVFDRLTTKDVEPMLNGERQCSNSNVRANLVRILGNLARLLIATKNDSVEGEDEVVKLISGFLLDVSGSETEAWVAAEALDALMDLFSDDETDKLALEVDLVARLRNLLPVFKNKVRQQRKSLKENSSIVSTVNGNIARFVRYKEKRLRSCP